MPEFRVRIHSLSAAGLTCGSDAEQIRLHANFDSYKEFDSECLCHECFVAIHAYLCFGS